MKKIIVVSIIALLLITSLGTAIGTAHRLTPRHPLFDRLPVFSLFTTQPGSDDDFEFSPTDIELKDDAFHNADTFHFTEWWYFDAILDNEHSVQMVFQVMSLLNMHVMRVKLNMYKQGTLYLSKEQFCLPSEFSASSQKPLIFVNGNQVMKGYIDDGQWKYDISLVIDKVSVNLRFVGTTDGWKGSVPVGEWAVPLPKADVEGTITLHTKTIEAKGIGYHDHNWQMTAAASKNLGWIWGKTHTESFTITYSTILTLSLDEQPIVMINRDDDGYIPFDADAIDFTIEQLQWKNGMFIPTAYEITVDDSDVTLHLRGEVEDIHPHRVPGIASYWRYHVHCTGDITVDGHQESIDDMQIAEVIRFW